MGIARLLRVGVEGGWGVDEDMSGKGKSHGRLVREWIGDSTLGTRDSSYRHTSRSFIETCTHDLEEQGKTLDILGSYYEQDRGKKLKSRTPKTRQE